MRYIAYYRVSTPKQGESGLGLEAQQRAVADYLKAAPLAEYVEIETGANNQRPNLAEAIAGCKRHKATLIIAKLDRLARNVHFISGLMESGIDFIAVDNPHANKLMVHMLAAFAEHEREMISKRTKEALQAAKARGVKLGGDRGSVPTPYAVQKAIANRQEQASRIKVDLRAQISAIQEAKGVKGLKALARELTAQGVPTSRGGNVWQATMVKRILEV